MINGSLVVSCAKCNLCEGSGYQAPPALIAGKIDAPILVIGQNPGEIKPSDLHRQWWARALTDYVGMKSTEASPDLIHTWYTWDFGTSSGSTKLAGVLGLNWMANGLFTFTNAVRCRTPGNESPSNEMIETCEAWTKMLIGQRLGIIMMGNIARSQILKEDSSKSPWGQVKKHPTLGLVLSIKHYSAWTGSESDNYHEAVGVMIKALGLEAK